MKNKSLIKKRFSKSLKTYDDNAFIQKQTAEKLISLLPETSYEKVFETGALTGILTKELIKKIKFNSYTYNDIIPEAKFYIDKIIPEAEFFEGDIEEISLSEKFNLIISNASLQWCSDIYKTISKLTEHLNEGGILAFSIFGSKNLKEIKRFFDIDNQYADIERLKEKYNLINYISEEIKIYFDNPVDIIKHFKLTGVNALKEVSLTKSRLKEFEEEYGKKYSQGDKVYLTYNPVYIILYSK